MQCNEVVRHPGEVEIWLVTDEPLAGPALFGAGESFFLEYLIVSLVLTLKVTT